MVHASGIGTYISNIVPQVIAAKPDCRFELLGDSDELQAIAWTQADNVRIVECRSPIYSIAEQFELFLKISSATSLFWSPHYNIPLLYRGKLLVTVHDVFHMTMPQYLRGVHKKLYARTLFQTVMRKADGILCPSKYTVGELIRITGVQRDEIRVAYNGVDENWFTVTGHDNPHSRPYLLFVGNVKPHKNLFGLIRAFESISSEIPHDLVVVGKKEGFITSDEQIGPLAHRLRDRVHFTGYVDDSALWQHVAHADVLVLPSFYEGFGLPPVEAMACGCPVIVSTSGSLPEVCGDAAVYCNPYDFRDIAECIVTLLKDKPLRDRLVAKGKERARQFTWQNCARETLLEIDRILAS
jgi:glycosyltransferase involved in cell wall biosynthesis